MKKNIYYFSGKIGLFIIILILFSACDDDSSTGPGQLPDTQNPSVIIQSPTSENTYVTTSASLDIQGIASDNRKLEAVRWTINQSQEQNTAGLNQWEATGVSILDGDNIFTVEASDEANNSTFDTLIITKNKYLTFLGAPQATPKGVLNNDPTFVRINVQIAPNPNLITSSVQLIKVDEMGTEIEMLTQMYDDGDLLNGDEIKGDNIYSCIYRFTLNTSIKLRIKAETSEMEGDVEGFSSVFSIAVFDPVSSSEINEVKTIQTNSVDKLNELIDENNFENTIEKTVEWLNSLAEVQNATLKAGNIHIKYTSGLIGGIIISQQGDDGQITQGGISGAQIYDRENKNIPLSIQTRGTRNSSSILLKNLQSNIILDKDVLIYEPFEADFDPFDKGDDVKDEFEQSAFPFNITHYKNQECTIDILNGLAEFGYIYIDTHGSNGEWILTGQIVDENDDYDLLIRDGQLATFTVVIWDILFYKKTDEVYGVSDDFISSIPGTLPSSIVFNSSCQGTMTNLLSNAFFSKGARTYLGVDESAYSDFLKEVSIQFAHNLVVEENTTGEAFNNISNRQDPKSGANLEIIGSQEMYYTNTLINGDFEFGNLTAWSKDGDGRVISQLGYLVPPGGNYMGLISSGLGFTTSSGEISQSFNVGNAVSILSLDWNFLSEEFLEFVGSQYQDYFKISIFENDNEYVAFEKSIDVFDSEYDLIDVSPDIVFDQGDVYMTGWQSLQIDISDYQGKNITLVLSIGDIGDSIYDSVALIDNIILE